MPPLTLSDLDLDTFEVVDLSSSLDTLPAVGGRSGSAPQALCCSCCTCCGTTCCLCICIACCTVAPEDTPPEAPDEAPSNE